MGKTVKVLIGFGVLTLGLLGWYTYSAFNRVMSLRGQPFDYFYVLILLLSVLSIFVPTILIGSQKAMEIWEELRDKVIRLRLHRKQNEKQLDNMESIFNALLAGLQQGGYFPEQFGDSKFVNRNTRLLEAPSQLAKPVLDGTIVYPELISKTSKATCVLFIGTRGQGKTNNMLALMNKWEDKKIIVFDTHASPAKWPYAAHVYGSELGLTETQRIESMAENMKHILYVMNKRLDTHRATGKKDFDSLCIFIDEFTDLPDLFKSHLNIDLGQFFTRPILNGGRKVNINFVWGCHSDRASALGLKGYYDLMSSFDLIVYLKGNFESDLENEPYALVKQNNLLDGETKYRLAPKIEQPLLLKPPTTAEVKKTGTDQYYYNVPVQKTTSITPEKIELAYSNLLGVSGRKPSLTAIAKKLDVTDGSNNLTRIREGLRELGFDY